MSGSVLIPIPSDRIDSVWPQVKDRLQAAVKTSNGRYSLIDVYGFLRAKDLCLWASVRDKCIEAIAVTEIINYPGRKMCYVRILTGENYRNWVHLESGIADWAESEGCDGMEADARWGWKRVFKHYTSPHIKLERMFDKA